MVKGIATSRCQTDARQGSSSFYVTAPASGLVPAYDKGVHLTLPANTHLAGIIDALRFSGINDPDVRYVGKTAIDLGHVKNVVTGRVVKGQKLADVDLSSQNAASWPPIVAYQVFVVYGGTEYAMSPSLFHNEIEFGCVAGSPFGCTPIPQNYAP